MTTQQGKGKAPGKSRATKKRKPKRKRSADYRVDALPFKIYQTHLIAARADVRRLNLLFDDSPHIGAMGDNLLRLAILDECIELLQNRSTALRNAFSNFQRGLQNIRDHEQGGGE